MKKTFITVLLAGVLYASLSLCVFAEGETMADTTPTTDDAVMTVDAEETVKNGWYDVDGNWYYYVDGNPVTNTFKEIGGNTYYLNGEGIMETGPFYYYDGVNNPHIMADANGVIITAESWCEYNGDWYYVKENGELAEKEILAIGGTGYYFQWDATLYSKVGHLLIGTGNDEYTEVYVTNGGALASGWYTSDFGTCYYDPNEYYMYKDVIFVDPVDGNTYYVNDGGSLATSTIIIKDGMIYGADENGVLTELGEASEGWFTYDGHTYYCLDGELVRDQFLDIDGARYYFDWDGWMIADRFYWVWDDETEQDYRYWFAEDGQLLSGWYTDEWDDKRYFDPETYRMYEDVLFTDPDDGNMYYVDENGWLVRNTSFAYGDSIYEADYYGVVTEIGQAEEGWTEIGGNWYYCQDGSFVKGQFLVIGGTTYYFNSEGVMVTGSFYAYNEAVDEWVTMFANEDGAVLTTKTGWHQHDDIWYYFKSPGILAADEFLKIGNITYRFDWDGWMCAGGVYEYYDREAENWYYTLIREDGMVVNNEIGWYEYDNNWYYFENYNQLIVHELYTIGGKSYYFNYDGIMQTGAFDVYDPDAEEWVWKLADENGVVLTTKTGWYEYDGNWYYFKSAGVLATNELLDIGTSTYSFDYEGVMEKGYIYDSSSRRYITSSSGALYKNAWAFYQNEWYYASSDGTLYRRNIYTINGKDYLFDSYGTMSVGLGYCAEDDAYYISDKDGIIIKKAGWQKVGLDWYYTDATGKCYSEKWIGDKYYVTYDGRMAVGTVWIDDSYYYFDTDGVYTGKCSAASGWIKLNNEWYYTDADGKPYTGWVNGTYYIDEGKMRYESYVYEEDSDTWYFVRYDGTVVKNGWYKIVSTWGDDTWIYANEDGTLASDEWKYSSGKWYYFNASSDMATGLVYIDGSVNLFDSNGCWIPTTNGKYTGWMKAGYSWYYFYKDGTLLEDTESAVIDGTTYYFWYDGELRTNEVDYDNDKIYYYNENGIRKQLTAGWNYCNGEWYYMEEDDSPAHGLKNINGSYYYFNSMGYMEKGSIWVEDWNGYYFFNNSGAYQYVNTGWVEADGYWYYYVNGAPITAGVHLINGKYYSFYSNGFMESFEPYYSDYMFTSSGLVKNAWHYDGSHWYYADASGRYVRGECVIGGKTYYFNTAGVWVK